ncbi:MAG: hypothetical protein HS111_21655 [Kofleriaceae bacterium]|nr:hypothetical protein [Kofleriaceae bacterium]
MSARGGARAERPRWRRSRWRRPGWRRPGAPRRIRPTSGSRRLRLASVQPGLVVTGSTLALGGDSFVAGGGERPAPRAQSAGRAVDVTVAARFVDYDHMTAETDAGVIAELGGAAPGASSGSRARPCSEVVSAVDGERLRQRAADLGLTDVAAWS